MIKVKLFSIAILALGIVLFLGLTSPNNASLLMYAIVFFLIYSFCLLLISVIMDIAYTNINQKMRFFIATVLAFSPTALVALSSLSSISVVDVFFAVTLPVAIVWYGLKNNSVN